MPEAVKDGTLAFVQLPSGRTVLGQYRDPGNGWSPYWSFFGTDYTLSPDEVRVLRQVELVEVIDGVPAFWVDDEGERSGRPMM